jgi:hypothetical protein
MVLSQVIKSRNKLFFHVDERLNEIINSMFLVCFFEEVVEFGEIDLNARTEK